MQFTHPQTSEKIKFIAYIYIRLNQIRDEKSSISAKVEAEIQFRAVFLLIAEQRQWFTIGLLLNTQSKYLQKFYLPKYSCLRCTPLQRSYPVPPMTCS